jgi:hypothetical protein
MDEVRTMWNDANVLPDAQNDSVSMREAADRSFQLDAAKRIDPAWKGESYE